jgi:adenylylsulfate kinase-like enzyme
MSGLFCFWLFVIHHQTATQAKIMATNTVTMYRRTLAAVITAFTGISDPFEPPAKPELELHTDHESVEESVELVLPLLRERGCDA